MLNPETRNAKSLSKFGNRVLMVIAQDLLLRPLANILLR